MASNREVLEQRKLPKLLELEFRHTYYLYGDKDINVIQGPRYCQTRRVYYIEGDKIRNNETPVSFTIAPYGLRAERLPTWSSTGFTFKSHVFEYKDYGLTWFLEKIF